jgi:hypothetical protein|tara:strand:+ start:231 stop:428 length:198 start_codon:yes stop_codon:yes gene_type:complete
MELGPIHKCGVCSVDTQTYKFATVSPVIAKLFGWNLLPDVKINGKHQIGVCHECYNIYKKVRKET